MKDPKHIGNIILALEALQFTVPDPSDLTDHTIANEIIVNRGNGFCLWIVLLYCLQYYIYKLIIGERRVYNC